MYVEKLQIYNFRNFAETEMTLNYPGRVYETGINDNGDDSSALVPLSNVNLFVGNNGAGKTSVFRALCLAILGDVLNSSGFQAEYLVRRTTNSLIDAQEKIVTLMRSLYVDKKHNTAACYVDILLHNSDKLEGAIRSFSVTLPDRVFGLGLVERSGDTEIVKGVLSHIPVTDAHDDREVLEVSILNHPLRYEASPAFLLMGYGANRRTERPEGYSEQNRGLRYRRVAGLFEDHLGLVPFTYGCLQLKDLDYFDEARELLNSLLPDEVKLTNQRDSNLLPLFNRDGLLLPFNALSDGFRTFIGWVWDMLLHIARVQPKEGKENQPKLADMTGIVIVDEIDLFLHPEWQRVVVPTVAKTFPNLQFLFSSHSPLVAGGLQPQNLYVLETESDGTAIVKQYEENIYGLPAGQVLTSSYFGLNSTRAPGTGTLSDYAHSRLNGVVPTVTNGEQAEPRDRAREMNVAVLDLLDNIADEEESTQK